MWGWLGRHGCSEYMREEFTYSVRLLGIEEGGGEERSVFGPATLRGWKRDGGDATRLVVGEWTWR